MQLSEEQSQQSNDGVVAKKKKKKKKKPEKEKKKSKKEKKREKKRRKEEKQKLKAKREKGEEASKAPTKQKENNEKKRGKPVNEGYEFSIKQFNKVLSTIEPIDSLKQTDNEQQKKEVRIGKDEKKTENEVNYKHDQPKGQGRPQQEMSHKQQGIEDGGEKGEKSTGQNSPSEDKENLKGEQTKTGGQQAKQQTSRAQEDFSGEHVGPGECSLNELGSEAANREAMLEDKRGASITENSSVLNKPNALNIEDGSHVYQTASNENWDEECGNSELAQEQSQPSTFKGWIQQQPPNVSRISQEPNTPDVHNEKDRHEERQLPSDQSKSGPPKKNTDTNREAGVSQYQSNTSGGITSLFTSVVDKTKSMLGFSNNQVILSE